MDEDRIDFSALDPSTDRDHWEELVGAITTRAVAERQPSLWRQLHLWARPALAAATVVMVAVCGATYLAAPASGEQTDPAMTLLSWAANDEVPSTTEILNTLTRQP